MQRSKSLTSLPTMSTSTGTTGQGGQGAGGAQGTGTTGQGQSTTTSTPFKPTKPIMGDLEQVSHDQYVPYTGGVPKEDGSIKMTQRGLIVKILTATNLQDANSNHTPAPQTPLSSDPGGADMTET